jgi:stress response protein YsnF/uncharacterized membrane protein
MAKTVVGLFDNPTEAERVIQSLVDSGFSRDDISLVANNSDNRYGNTVDTTGTDHPVANEAGKGAEGGAIVGGVAGLLAGLGLVAIPGIGPVLAAGWIATTLAGAGVGAIAGGLIGSLVSLGIPDEHAHVYAEGVRRGGSLVVVRTDDARAEAAADILRDNGAIDVDKRHEDYQTTGFSRFDDTAPAYTADEVVTERSRYAAPAAVTTDRTINTGDEARIPVVEEQIAVGKRAVTNGGARIYTHVTERPVQESVSLTEEHVEVDRHAVDRPLQPGEANAAFREGTIDVTEVREVPVVTKTARVVEEVAINKNATQRTETVNDTVRRTDVDVEELNDGATLAEDREFDTVNRDVNTTVNR